MTEFSIPRMIPLKLTSSENFGFVPPIGSKQEYLHFIKTNLNAGIGNACAGHCRHIEVPAVLVNLFNSE